MSVPVGYRGHSPAMLACYPLVSLLIADHATSARLVATLPIYESWLTHTSRCKASAKASNASKPRSFTAKASCHNASGP